MVKMLTAEQLPALARLGPDFYRESGLPGRFVPEIFVAKWTAFLGLGVGFILGLFQGDEIMGGFGAIVSDDFNDGATVASECFWFVKPEARGRGFELLLAYEQEARRRGAVRCSMIHLRGLQPERLGQLYEKRGYRAVETAYMKELT
jgi:GNAT superfamily N-acetyltransferase